MQLFSKIKKILDKNKFCPGHNFDHVLSVSDYENRLLLYLRGYEKIDLLEHPLNIINKLFEWHFDVFGLLENNLAIDKNTL